MSKMIEIIEDIEREKNELDWNSMLNKTANDILGFSLHRDYAPRIKYKSLREYRKLRSIGMKQIIDDIKTNKLVFIHGRLRAVDICDNKIAMYTDKLNIVHLNQDTYL